LNIVSSWACGTLVFLLMTPRFTFVQRYIGRNIGKANQRPMRHGTRTPMTAMTATFLLVPAAM